MPKILIDVPDEIYHKIKNGYVPLGILKYLKNGTVLPDDATNGEIIGILAKALFPEETIYSKSAMRIEIGRFDEYWGNLPFKRRQEDGNDKCFFDT